MSDFPYLRRIWLLIPVLLALAATRALGEATPETPKSETVKAEPAKNDAAKSEAAKPEATKPASSETAKAAPAQADPPKTETAKPETAKTETAKAEPAKPETAPAEPVKTDTSKTETVKAESNDPKREVASEKPPLDVTPLLPILNPPEAETAAAPKPAAPNPSPLVAPPMPEPVTETTPIKPEPVAPAPPSVPERVVTQAPPLPAQPAAVSLPTPPSVYPPGSEVAIILARDKFFPSEIHVRAGMATTLVFSSVNRKPAALVIEPAQTSRQFASLPRAGERQPEAPIEITRELGNDRVTTISFEPAKGRYTFHDALGRARGVLVVE